MELSRSPPLIPTVIHAPVLTPIGWTPDEPDAEIEPDAPQFISGLDVVIGDARIVIGTDAKVHVILPDYHLTATIKADTIDAPGHPGNTQEEAHPLQGVAHLNVAMPIFPPKRLGESGILADGPSAALTPENYVVPG